MRSRWIGRSLGLVPGLLLLLVAMPALAQSGKAWMGVTTQRVTSELRDALDLKSDGVLVNGVVDNGPADRAGIRKGDVITTVNGRTVASPGALADLVQGLRVGSNASVRVVRDGAGQTYSVLLKERPADLDDEDSWSTPAPGDDEESGPRVRAWKNGKEVDPDDLDFHMEGMEGLRGLGRLQNLPGFAWSGDRPRLGVRLQEMNRDLAEYFGGTNGRGALVVEVIEDTPAEKAGIKAGDVITAVGNTTVDDADDLQKALADVEGNVSLTVVRKGVRKTIEADLGDAPRSSMAWRMRDGRAPRAPMAPKAPSPPRMMRMAPDRDGDSADMRRELDELRRQLDELKKQLEERDR